MILEVKDAVKKFGGILALNKMSISMDSAEILGLVGPNGAGKTTLINCISGYYKLDSGVIRFMDKSITNLPAHVISRLGIVRTYQIPRPNSDITVLDNVMIGALFSQAQRNIRDAYVVAEDLVKLVGLSSKRESLAKNLTLVEKKFLDLARALSTNPKLLMIDELIAGLNPVEAEQAINLIKKIRYDYDLAIIFIEHVMSAVMRLSDRVIVMHEGKKIAEGAPTDIIRDEKVVEVYLGREYMHA
jgi:ABC-type branched-subunit amino acid transport system ATPase component